MNPFKKYLWLGVAVLIVLWHIAYGAFWNRHGRLALQHDYDTARIEANAEARRMEQSRQARVDEAARVAVGRAAAIRADGDRARASADSLRNDLSAVRLHAQESRAASDNAVRVLSELFGSCTAAYTDLALEADRATSEVKTLREVWPR